VGGGLAKLADFSGTAQLISAAGLPFATMGVVTEVLIEVGAGALLLSGFRVRWAAAVLATFTLATALIFHRNLADPAQLPHFMKNLLIIGGLLQIVQYHARDEREAPSAAREVQQ
jgi:putative oxidoreductase